MAPISGRMDVKKLDWGAFFMYLVTVFFELELLMVKKFGDGVDVTP